MTTCADMDECTVCGLPVCYTHGTGEPVACLELPYLNHCADCQIGCRGCRAEIAADKGDL